MLPSLLLQMKWLLLMFPCCIPYKGSFGFMMVPSSSPHRFRVIDGDNDATAATVSATRTKETTTRRLLFPNNNLVHGYDDNDVVRYRRLQSRYSRRCNNNNNNNNNNQYGSYNNPNIYSRKKIDKHPRLFMSVPNSFDIFTSGLASMCRLPRGVTVQEQQEAITSSSFSSSSSSPTTTSSNDKNSNNSNNNNNFALKRLYDVETNLACKKVRERITELDLVVDLVIPCGKNSRALTLPDYEYKLPVLSSSSSTTAVVLPQLVISENGMERTLVGDDDILSYLNSKFPLSSSSSSSSSSPIKPSDTTTSILPDVVQESVLPVLLELSQTALGIVSTWLRLGRGVDVCSAASSKRLNVPRPQQPLILYSYEGNQFCRLVREVLVELDLPYQLRSVGKGSSRRLNELALLSNDGSTLCPFLIDPNNKDVKMRESQDIIRYLYKTYALWTPPNEIVQFANDYVMPFLSPFYRSVAPLQAKWSVSSSSSTTDPTQAVEEELEKATMQIEQEIDQNKIVIYTYQLSPFCIEAKNVLDNINLNYTEISLGLEWIPGLMAEPFKRAALLSLTGQSSLPHIFINGKSIGGLFSGTPGLIPALEQDQLQSFLDNTATTKQTTSPAVGGESMSSFE